jgi:hypothetical protein
MDEGLNSYYDHLYSAEYYGKETFEEYGIPKFLSRGADGSPMAVFTQSLFFEHRDQAPETTSTDLTPPNYILAAYEKPAMSLAILAKHVGLDKFEELIKKYFNVWKFKHPQPDDFKKIWTDDAASVGDVSWFFDGLIGSTARVDYKVMALNQDDQFWKVTIKNVGKVAVPFTVSGLKGDSAIYTTRLTGVSAGDETVAFIPKKAGISMLTVDFKQLLPDANRTNNNIKTRGFMPKIEPLRVKFLFGLDNSRRTNLYVSPIMASNVYDGLMLGAWLHNGALPLKKWEWSVAPMYSFGTQSLAGLGNVNCGFFFGKNKVNLSLGARRFADNFNQNWFKIGGTYSRFTPSVSVEFRGNPADKFTSQLQLRHLFIAEETWLYTSAGDVKAKDTERNGITELVYSGLLKNALGNANFKIALEHQVYKDAFDERQSYLRTTVEGRKDFMYQRNKLISARVFVGGFLNNTRENSGKFYGTDARGTLGLVKNGATDYHYDGLWFGRTEQTGAVSQQIDPSTEGGMKFVLPKGSTTQLGFSNSFVAALNLKMDLPVNLPRFLQLKPYFDVGYFADKRAQPNGQTLLMSGGIAWEFFGEAAAIYFPIYFNGASDDPNSFRAYAVTQRGGYKERITFSLDLKKINPLTWMKGLLSF